MQAECNKVKVHKLTGKRKLWVRFKEDLPFHILSLPVVLKVLVFSYLPMFGIILAFKDYNYRKGILESKWVGFKNFEFFFKSIDAARVTINTVYMNAIFIITGIIFTMLFALLLYEIASKYALKFYQTSYFIPHFLSWVVIMYAFDSIFSVNGSFIMLLDRLGFGRINIGDYPQIWPPLLTVTHLWKHLGYSILINYAILMGVDLSYYEAAEIDGASRIQMALHISIPFLIPMTVISLILSIGNIFNADFGLFYFIPKQMYNTQLLPTTDVIDTYVYRALKNRGDIGMSSAVGLYQSVVGFILISITNYIVKKINKDLSLY